MKVLNHIIVIIGLLTIGYFALKEGFHKETAEEKLIKSIQRPPLRRFPKWYGALIGVVCWVAALYFTIKIFLAFLGLTGE